MAKIVKNSASLTDQSQDSLQKAITDKQADLLGYRKGLVSGELKNTAIIKATKREIARLKTALAGKEGDK